MKKNTLLLFGLFFFIASCNNLSVYNKDYNFDKNQWQKKDPKTFEFTIDNDAKLYDVIFSVSHVYDYQFDSFPLSFKWTKPDGTSEIIPFTFWIKDKNGKGFGECAGDICDVNTALMEKVKLQKGKHQIEVSHSFQFDYLPNIIHIGLDISARE